mmetsp:Transcript_16307/g.41342  ORF Transcript_16307/g.41342 Transcript_16307/m.41342 type:complete len:163 (+) Transcript_16307:90-578(+)
MDVHLHTASIAFGSTIFVFYIIFNTLLQYYYYKGRVGDVKVWKTQAGKSSAVGKAAARWWLPIFSNKEKRPPHYAIFATMNVLLQVACATTAIELVCRGYSSMRFEPVENEWKMSIVSFFLGIVLHMMLEYYWHRLMHLRWFYCTFHKYHHYFKSPEPFDDM